MGDENLDVKEAADPSPAAAAPAQGADDNKGASSSGAQAAETQGDKAGETLQDVVKAAYVKATAEAPPAEGDKAEADAASDVQNLNKTGDKAAKEGEKEGDKEEVAEGEKVDDKAEAKEGDEPKEGEEPKGPVPLERFQEVVKARQDVEQKLRMVEPTVTAHNSIVEFCEKQNITPELFSQALEIQALIINNPTEALKRLTPVMDSLQGLTGDKLPQDLQVEVDAGDLPLARAKEIAKFRAQTQHGESYSKMTAEKAKVKEIQNFQQTLVNASQMWENSKRKTDPDYKPRAKDTDPMGKHELVNACFLQKLYAQDERGNYVHPTDTPAKMTALLEQAYQEVSKTFQAQRPKPPAKRPLTRNGSSANIGNVSYADAKTLREAVDMAANLHR